MRPSEACRYTGFSLASPVLLLNGLAAVRIIEDGWLTARKLRVLGQPYRSLVAIVLKEIPGGLLKLLSDLLAALFPLNGVKGKFARQRHPVGILHGIAGDPHLAGTKRHEHFPDAVATAGR